MKHNELYSPASQVLLLNGSRAGDTKLQNKSTLFVVNPREISTYCSVVIALLRHSDEKLVDYFVFHLAERHCKIQFKNIFVLLLILEELEKKEESFYVCVKHK